MWKEYHLHKSKVIGKAKTPEEKVQAGELTIQRYSRSFSLRIQKLPRSVSFVVSLMEKMNSSALKTSMSRKHLPVSRETHPLLFV